MRWTLGPVESMLKTEEQISIIFAVVFVIGLTLVSGLITQRVIGKPLEVLAAAMRDVEGGDLSRRIPVETLDEVGRLSEGFNRMLERLSKADAQIRAFNQRLGAEIERATHDLSEKNLALGQLNRLLNDMRLDNASKVRLATLGQLAAQLAHEIGTPLSSVSGHIQLALLQRDLPAALRDGSTSRRARSSASARSCATTSIRRGRSSPSAGRPRSPSCSRRRSSWSRAWRPTSGWRSARASTRRWGSW